MLAKYYFNIGSLLIKILHFLIGRVASSGGGGSYPCPFPPLVRVAGKKKCPLGHGVISFPQKTLSNVSVL